MIITNHLLRSGCNSLNPSGLRSLHFFFSSHLFLSKSVVRVPAKKQQTQSVDTSEDTSVYSTHCRRTPCSEWVVKAVKLSTLLYLSAFLLFMCEKHALSEAAGDREFGLNRPTDERSDSEVQQQCVSSAAVVCRCEQGECFGLAGPVANESPVAGFR